MRYPITRSPNYDFKGQSYADTFPNLHRYPAAMPPQIGIAILQEFGIHQGTMLDPYCGSGSSFIAGLMCGLKHFAGYDLNPLAVLITRAKYTWLDKRDIAQARQMLKQRVRTYLAHPPANLADIRLHNANYWFAGDVLAALQIIYHALRELPDEAIQTLFLVPFSEILRACSYTRSSEFKLYRLAPKDIASFNVDPVYSYFQKLDWVIAAYESYYLPYLQDIQLQLKLETFRTSKAKYDVVLTSPPYGDSQTTVAYGQFSVFINEWLGISHARQIDKLLMGGKKADELYQDGVLVSPIARIASVSFQRALQVSAFYKDLATSINEVARAITPGGFAIYLVGNRTVKGVQLPTDQFIAEQFERHGFKHCVTYERALSNKVMPNRNSPSNQIGITAPTMSKEYLVVCQKDTADD